uniref:Integrase catalytic domain-containing protein n=1 Tax=Periophthalmus magnuspinnatus TaxID=409849 RepID=A0A3B4B6M1_9GOBI
MEYQVKLFSDNEPQFSSESFKRFAEEWNFVHTTSSLLYPQSNGLVEKSVQTVKRLLAKAKDSRTDYYQSLLVYRTTPLECGMSPARLLMGRRLRSNLPIQESLLKTKEGGKVKRYKEEQKAKQKLYYDRGTQNNNTWAQKVSTRHLLKTDESSGRLCIKRAQLIARLALADTALLPQLSDPRRATDSGRTLATIHKHKLYLCDTTAVLVKMHLHKRNPTGRELGTVL